MDPYAAGRELALKLGCRCAACPHAVDGKPSTPIWAKVTTQDPQAGLLGEGPGPREVELKEPFVGPTGRKLNKALADASLVRAKLHVFNAQLCPPKSGSKNAAAMQQATECCRPAFEHQLKHLSPKAPVLAMGRQAWQALAGRVPKGGMNKGRGFVREVNGRPFVATWHPTAAFFYDPWELGVFLLDLKRFKRLITGNLRARPSKLILWPTPRDLWKLVKESGNRIATDDETFGPLVMAKDPTKARLRVVGFGHQDAAAAVLWERASDALKQAVVDIWSDPKVTKVTHNGIQYDRRVNQRHGIPCPPETLEDTLCRGKALNTNAGLSLANQATLYDDPPPWKEDTDEEDEKGLSLTDDVEKLLHYNCLDCVETARVDAGQLAETEWAEPRVQNLYDIHKRLAYLAAKMETRGFQVDFWNRGVLAVGLEEEHQVRLQMLKEHVNLPAFRGVPEDVRSLLWRRHEKEGLSMFSMEDPWDPDMYTETGRVSIDQKSLISLLVDPSRPKELKDFLKRYWATSGVKKACSTFVVSQEIDDALGPDGRVRTSWNPNGPGTGRWGGSQPNLMNYPEEKKD